MALGNVHQNAINPPVLASPRLLPLPFPLLFGFPGFWASPDLLLRLCPLLDISCQELTPNQPTSPATKCP